MNKKIWRDFQICISVPLNTVNSFQCFLQISFCIRCIADKFSSNINEVIRPDLNFIFLYFFYDKILHAQKAQNKKCV